MNIFIEIPTWLGDAVMTTPAIENIVAKYPQCELIIFGSFLSTTLFKNHPNVKKIIIDDSKKNFWRYLNLYTLAKGVGKVDIALSFRRNFTTKFLLFFIDSQEKYYYQRLDSLLNTHQVIRYNDFVNKSFNLQTIPKKLKIYTNPDLNKNQPKKNLTLGINPGATYGSAKRWYPQEFAKVAIELSKKYDIKIFGGPNEVDISLDIEKELQKSNINNYENLSGKTSIEKLIQEISDLDLFITNDSGPMHIAAAFGIPTVAIFGPTRDLETHQWGNPKEMIIRKELECSPCMKRVCPLKHHDCMKLITAVDVLNRIEKKEL